ncbi:hypothetical protein GYH30_029821 [Glycine max]|uniref:Uncharacterized protein n=1 Tax=Glycine max TaxID=3847 RepID=K7LMQ3_SOYBN|nr:hypothetical protein GYH30_029821 [Glycine max]KHN35007.1 hypothetical protein glysoja_004773 [Glycine soja]
MKIFFSYLLAIASWLKLEGKFGAKASSVQGNALKIVAKPEFQAKLKFRQRAKDSSLAKQELVAEEEFCCVHLRSVYFG